MEKRFTIAKRDVDLEALIVTGVFIVLMVVWACLVEDKRLIFIPLFLMAVILFAFISLVYRFIVEPKIAIQADSNGIYLYYRKRKEIFVEYKDIIEVSGLGLRNKYGRLVITTKENQYKSIRTYECNDKLLSRINSLLDAEDKEEYLISHT